MAANCYSKAVGFARNCETQLHGTISLFRKLRQAVDSIMQVRISN